MKTNADKHRRDVQYTVGDWVYLRLRPYRQKSLNPTYSKLAKRYFGPYQVTERIGPVAYKLALPNDSRIHNVFHVSLLKAHQGAPPSDIVPLPPLAVDHHPVVTPLTILDWKLDSSVTPPRRLVLVQWMGLPPEDTSWELWDDLQQSYNLEDEVVFGGAGVDSNMQNREPHNSINGNNSRPKRVTRKPTYLNDFE